MPCCCLMCCGKQQPELRTAAGTLCFYFLQSGGTVSQTKGGSEFDSCVLFIPFECILKFLSCWHFCTESMCQWIRVNVTVESLISLLLVARKTCHTLIMDKSRLLWLCQNSFNVHQYMVRMVCFFQPYLMQQVLRFSALGKYQ